MEAVKEIAEFVGGMILIVGVLTFLIYREDKKLKGTRNWKALIGLIQYSASFYFLIRLVPIDFTAYAYEISNPVTNIDKVSFYTNILGQSVLLIWLVKGIIQYYQAIPEDKELIVDSPSNSMKRKTPKYRRTVHRL